MPLSASQPLDSLDALFQVHSGHVTLHIHVTQTSTMSRNVQQAVTELSLLASETSQWLWSHWFNKRIANIHTSVGVSIRMCVAHVSIWTRFAKKDLWWRTSMKMSLLVILSILRRHPNQHFDELCKDRDNI